MWPPPRIDRYELDPNPIGEGGFSFVYRASDPKFPGSQLVVKLLKAPGDLWPDELAHDSTELDHRWAQTRSDFVEESQLMRHIKGPSIAAVYDTGSVRHPDYGDIPYLVSDYAEAGTLRDRLRNLGRPVTTAEALELVDGIEQILGFLAQIRPGFPNGIVHRDIKPSNFLIQSEAGHRPDPAGELFEQDEALIVTDFGLAKAIQPDNDSFTSTRGTDLYCAPEQLEHDPSVGATVDIFSASVVLVEALTQVEPQRRWLPAQPVFDDETFRKTGPFEPGLRKALSVDRTDRFATVSAWAQTLRQSLNTPLNPTTLHPTKTHNPRPIQRPKPRTKSALAVAAVIVFVLVGAASAFASRSPFTQPQANGQLPDEKTGSTSKLGDGNVPSTEAIPESPEAEIDGGDTTQKDGTTPDGSETEPTEGSSKDSSPRETEQPTNQPTEPEPTMSTQKPDVSRCTTNRDVSFTGGLTDNGNGYGEDIKCPTANLASNGEESADRFTAKFEDCDFSGTLTATGSDGTRVVVDENCNVSSSQTFLTPEQGQKGLTLKLSDLDGTYRVSLHAN